MKKLLKNTVIIISLLILIMLCTVASAYAKASFEDVKILMDETGLIPEKSGFDWNQEVNKSDLSAVFQKLSGTEVNSESLNKRGLCKLLVEMTGYGRQIEISGGADAAYVSYAARLGITSNINNSEDKLTYTDMAIMIYNTFDIEIIEQAVYGGTSTYFITTGQTVLQKYFDIYKVEGVITSTERSSLYSSTHCADGYIEIDNVAYLYGGKLLGGDALGRRVRAYYRFDKGLDKKEIFSVLYEENGVTTVNMSEIKSLNDKTLSYKRDEKNIKKVLPLQAVVTINGVFKGYVSSLNDADMYSNSMRGKMFLIDNNGDNKVDVVNIIVYDIAIVKSVYADSEMISCKGKNIRLSEDDNDNGCQYSLVLDGKECSFSDILQWNALIIEYSQNKSGKRFYIINVVQRIVEGTVSEKSDDKVWINNNEYTVLPSIDINNIKIGMSGQFIIAGNNDIADIVSDTMYEYGYYIEHSSTHSKAEMLIVDCAGNTTVLPLAKKIRVNDSAPINAKSLGDYLSTPQLIGYSLNSDKLVSKIYTANIGYNKDKFSLCGERKERVYLNANGNQGFDWEYFSVPGTVTYYVDESGTVDEDAVTVGNLNGFAYNEKVDCAIYDANRVGDIGVLVIYSAQRTNFTESSSDVELVIEKMIYARDDEDEFRPQIVYFQNGERKKAFFSDDVVKATNSTNETIGSIPLPDKYMSGTYTDLKPGDIIKAFTNTKGEIYMYLPVFKADESHDLGAGYQNNGNSIPNRDSVYSKILYMEGDKVIVLYNGINRVYTITSQTVIYKYDKDAKEISIGSVADLTDVESAAFGESPTEALFYRAVGVLKAIMIFE